MSTEYRILCHYDQDELCGLVNVALKEGWQLQGGVAVGSCYDSQKGYDSDGPEREDWFAQAIIREWMQPPQDNFMRCKHDIPLNNPCDECGRK